MKHKQWDEAIEEHAKFVGRMGFVSLLPSIYEMEGIKG
jgi:hypothetical protein